ncbi:Major facilitator superfamily protein 24 [Agrobacterium tumefaciens str. CFBP 5621]|uniref:MFS transporter n=1 Tax=Agrobacterium tumefaciens TaxID=358 RepID=UPI0009B9D6A4|nr:MFS transporter [Agrobacterium tumefaciens]CUX51150.1 Major facilitator superfamily protein 24 [Agrobacterium tumefaciens str. CFBP 5621]
MTTHSSSPIQGDGSTALSILILGLSGFVLVTTEFLIIGLIPQVAREFAISTAQAGRLVSLFAFTVMLCGPFLTARLAHFERKSLFCTILMIFAASNLVAALAPNIWVLAIGRFIPALALPVFWGTASETAAHLVEPRHSGRAVARVYLGISAALVLGVPLGTVAATSIGWRGSFCILAIAALLLAATTWRFMPRLASEAQSVGSQHEPSLIRDKTFLAHVGLSVLVFIAMFTAYTFLADLLENVARIDPRYVGWWLMGFGLIGLVGNWMGGLAADRNPLFATLVFAVGLIVAMLLFTPAAQNQWLLGAVLGLWSISYTALFPVCQIRVMKAGKKAQALAATVNVSAANAGAGIGAITGGVVIDYLHLSQLGQVSAAIGAVAIVYAALILRAKKI